MNSKLHQLLPCPNKPNCVSSLSANKKQYIKPLDFSESRDHGMQKLVDLISSLKGTSIKQQDEYYLHAVFCSRFFRFKDDVEFLYDEDKHECHVRSASRSGHSDFGVNRRRVEKIRKLLVG